jgi:hypothetical protein
VNSATISIAPCLHNMFRSQTAPTSSLFISTEPHWKKTNMSAWPTDSTWESKFGCVVKETEKYYKYSPCYWKFQNTQCSAVILARQWTSVKPFQSAALNSKSGFSSVEPRTAPNEEWSSDTEFIHPTTNFRHRVFLEKLTSYSLAKSSTFMYAVRALPCS